MRTSDVFLKSYQPNNDLDADLIADLRDLRKLVRDFIGAERNFSNAAAINCSVDSRRRHLAHKAFEAIKTHLEAKP